MARTTSTKTVFRKKDLTDENLQYMFLFAYVQRYSAKGELKERNHKAGVPVCRVNKMLMKHLDALDPVPEDVKKLFKLCASYGVLKKSTTSKRRESFYWDRFHATFGEK